MSQQAILKELEEILEVDEGSLALETELEQVPSWDSLAVVSFMAVADEKFGKRLSAKQLEKVGKVSDLVELVLAAA